MQFKHKISRRLALLKGAAVAVLVAAACSDESITYNDETTAIDSAAVPGMGVSRATFSAQIATSTTNIGDRVSATSIAYIRSGPSVNTSLVGTQPIGAQGTIIAGPVVDATGDGLTRWQINFDSGVDGWGAAPYFNVTGSALVAVVTITPGSATIASHGTIQLTAVAKDAAGNVLSRPITWTSSDSTVATVTATGLVTDLADGPPVTIRATAGGVIGTSIITITPAALPPPPAPATKFSAGGRVRSNMPISVRSLPALSSTLLGVQPTGALGTVVAGPVSDNAGDGLKRWQINYDSGPDGWSAEDYLDTVATAAAPPPPASPVVASVTVSPKPTSLTLGGQLQLTAIAKDAAGATIAGVPMTWTSRNTLLATVSATGLVAGVAVGSMYVVVTAAGKTDSAQVTVLTVPVASLVVSPTTASRTVGQTVQLTATPKDLLGNTLTGRAMSWSTNNSAIATVNSSGLVSAVGAGSATITVTTEGKTATAAITVTAVAAPPPPTVRPGWYVSANGSSSASGSFSSPWNFATALSGAGGRIRPGDTVWVRGGTYYAPFRSTVNGQSGSLVVIRAYPGERAIIDGRNTSSDNFIVAGSYTALWGLEFTNTNTARSTSVYVNNYRANNVINNGSNNKYINIIVHDGGVAFYNYSNRSNVEVNGSIFYNNGWQGPTRGHGHAMYLKADAGPLVAKDNIIFNQFGYGIHAYTDVGDGLLNGLQIEGNVSFNNGSVATTGTSANVGNLGSPPANNMVMKNNMTYFSPGIGGTNLSLGSGSGLTATGNYVVGGSGLTQGSWSGATIGSNTVLASTGSRPTQVFVRPSAYEAGRANVIVYNWSGQGSVSVSMSGVLVPGDNYVVRHVFNLFGSPVASGTYSGGSIAIPLSSVSPPTPIGWSRSGPATGTSFGVYVVSKQ